MPADIISEIAATLLPGVGRGRSIEAPFHDTRRIAAKEDNLDRALELERFLAGVERSAFRVAVYALGHEDDALDAVQDAMIRLARKYAHKPSEEWKPLFFRILKNRIRDMQRRRSVRSRFMVWPGRREDAPDPVEQAEDERGLKPAEQLALDDAMGVLDEAIRALPERQRETFLLRTLEGLNVAETARAMGVTEGSVKTHYSRAVHSLREQLGEHWE